MVVHHRSDDGMVMYHRWSLNGNLCDIDVTKCKCKPIWICPPDWPWVQGGMCAEGKVPLLHIFRLSCCCIKNSFSPHCSSISHFDSCVCLSGAQFAIPECPCVPCFPCLPCLPWRNLKLLELVFHHCINRFNVMALSALAFHSNLPCWIVASSCFNSLRFILWLGHSCL